MFESILFTARVITSIVIIFDILLLCSIPIIIIYKLCMFCFKNNVCRYRYHKI